MTDWRGNGIDDADKTKIGFMVGALAGSAVLAWILLARGSGENQLTSSGFDVGGTSPIASRIGPARERRDDTGLSMVRLGEVAAGNAPAAGPAAVPYVPGAGAPAPADATAAVPAANGSASAARTAANAGEDGAAAAAALGVNAARDAGRLGGEKGLLSALVQKALEHPSALRYLLNNKTLVDAYFSRDLVAKNCSSGAALKSYLMNGNDPQGVSEEVGMAKMFLQNPEAAQAAAGSEFGKRMMDCPSVGQLSKDPGAALVIAGSNSQLLSLLSDPNAAKALATNPAASSLLSGVSSTMGH
jgi:hypothetical protein